MKKLLFLMLFSSAALACKEGIMLEATLAHFPTPRFSSLLNVLESEATVIAIVTTEGHKVSKFEILEISPSNLPIEPISTSLEKAIFDQSLYKRKVKFNFDIVIPEKLEPLIELSPIH